MKLFELSYRCKFPNCALESVALRPHSITPTQNCSLSQPFILRSSFLSKIYPEERYQPNFRVLAQSCGVFSNFDHHLVVSHSELILGFCFGGYSCQTHPDKKYLMYRFFCEENLNVYTFTSSLFDDIFPCESFSPKKVSDSRKVVQRINFTHENHTMSELRLFSGPFLVLSVSLVGFSYLRPVYTLNFLFPVSLLVMENRLLPKFLFITKVSENIFPKITLYVELHGETMARNRGRGLGMKNASLANVQKRRSAGILCIAETFLNFSLKRFLSIERCEMKNFERKFLCLRLSSVLRWALLEAFLFPTGGNYPIVCLCRELCALKLFLVEEFLQRSFFNFLC